MTEVTTANIAGMQNRLVYVLGVADTSAAMANVEGALIAAAALVDTETWIQVIAGSSLTAGAKVLFLKNSSDVCVEWSFDNSNAHFRQLPGDRDAIDIRLAGLTAVVSVHVRRDTTQSTAASSGFATANAIV